MGKVIGLICTGLVIGLSNAVGGAVIVSAVVVGAVLVSDKKKKVVDIDDVIVTAFINNPVNKIK